MIPSKLKINESNSSKDINGKVLEIARKEMSVNPEKEKNELTSRVLEMASEDEAAFYKFSDQIKACLKRKFLEYFFKSVFFQ